MKKIIPAIVLVIILATTVLVFYVLSNLDALVKAAIEKYGSQATQTAVRVESVKIDLSEGAGAINGLTIANPQGFAMPNAVSLGEISLKLDIQSLKQEPYIIDKIIVRAPQLFVEINQDNKTNLNQLTKNLSAGMPTSRTEDQAAVDETSAEQPRLIIRQVSFSDGNIQARVVPLKNKEYQLKLPALNMSNLGGNTGATPSELAREIISRLTDRAREEIKKKGIDQELDKFKAEARARVDEEKAQLKQKTDSQLEDKKQKVKDKLKDLFNR
ncbi:MAG: hypothetical protein ACN4GM_00920 [Gammaproteobacteria bacterium]